MSLNIPVSFEFFPQKPSKANKNSNMPSLHLHRTSLIFSHALMVLVAQRKTAPSKPFRTFASWVLMVHLIYRAWARPEKI